MQLFVYIKLSYYNCASLLQCCFGCLASWQQFECSCEKLVRESTSISVEARTEALEAKECASSIKQVILVHYVVHFPATKCKAVLTFFTFSCVFVTCI